MGSALIGLIVIGAAVVVGSPAADEVPPGQVSRQGTEEEDEGQALETRTGTIEEVTDEDGNVAYELRSGSDSIRLSVGPPWFWGDDHPLAPYVGTDVEVTGHVDEGTPSEHANPRAHQNAEERGPREPSFEVFSVDGNVIREPGKPPWAGGPSVVGERHPGFGHGARDGDAPGDED